MARRPARLERAGALTPRDRMWAAIRSLGAPVGGVVFVFSPVEVRALAERPSAEIHIDSVITYMTGLASAKPPYLERLGIAAPARSSERFRQYRLVRDTGVDTPLVDVRGNPQQAGVGNAQMWTAMKVLREFDRDDLARAASTPEHAVSVKRAQSYVTSLARAGYLALVVAPCRGRNARYRFNRAKNTGPRAPLVCRDGSVMDANTGEVVGRTAGTEAGALK